MSDKPPMPNPPTHGKPVTLSLTYYVNEWKVSACTNSVWPRPGMMLDEVEVTKLCDRDNWEVKIIDNQILQTVLGMVTTAIQLPKL